MIGKNGTRLVGIGTILLGALGAACSGGDDAPSYAPTASSPPAPSASSPNAPSDPPTPAAPPAASSAPAPAARPPVEAAPASEDDSPAALAPETLGARLVLWLRADQGVQGPANAVTIWKDQSPYGNDAIAQGTVSLTGAWINGHPALSFDGSTGYMSVANSTSLQFGTDDVTAFAVVAHQSDLSPSSRMILSKQDAASPYKGLGMYVNFSNTYGVGALLEYNGPTAKLDSAAPNQYASMKPMLVRAARTGGSSLAIDVGAKHAEASALQSGNPVNLSNTAKLRLGGQGGNEQTLLGNIAEVVLVRGALTSTETKSVTEYLTSKYAL